MVVVYAVSLRLTRLGAGARAQTAVGNYLPRHRTRYPANISKAAFT